MKKQNDKFCLRCGFSGDNRPYGRCSVYGKDYGRHLWRDDDHKVYLKIHKDNLCVNLFSKINGKKMVLTIPKGSGITVHETDRFIFLEGNPGFSEDVKLIGYV